MPRETIQGGVPATTISGTVSPTDTSLTLTSATGWPSGAYPFIVTIDRGETNEEQILATGRSGTVVSFPVENRGYNNTTAVEHSSGATIEHTIGAASLQEANEHTNDTTRDDHTQYLNNARHDVTARHAFGSALPTPAAPADVGTAAAAGVAGGPARADHVHELGAGSIDDEALFAAGVVPGTAMKSADFTAAGLALMDDADAAAQRTTLGLGSMATQAASGVAITGGSVDGVSADSITITSGSVSGITDLAVADGGTGASTAAGARTNLGIGGAITGAITVVADQPARVALSPAANDLALEMDFGHWLVYNGSAWVYCGDVPGHVIWSIATNAPTGYLAIAGQSIANADTTYPGLWAVVDAAFKSGTTLNLPDGRGRTIAAVDNLGGSDAGRLDWANALGTAGGAQTHTLVIGEMPSHDHVTAKYQAGNVDGPGQYGGGNNNAINNGAVTQTRGGGGAHNNMQPTLLLNAFVRL